MIFTQFLERTPLPKLPKCAAKEKNIKQFKKSRERRGKEKNTSTTQGKKDIQGVLRFNVNVFFGKKSNLVCI